MARSYAGRIDPRRPICDVMLVNPGPLRTRMRALAEAGRRHDDVEDAR
jgi:hypothetical protein